MHRPIRARVTIASVVISSLTLLSAASPAAAQTPASPGSAFPRPASPIIGAHACMCRAAGTAYEVGEKICLGERMAECTVVINVMNWRVTTEPCPDV